MSDWHKPMVELLTEKFDKIRELESEVDNLHLMIALLQVQLAELESRVPTQEPDPEPDPPLTPAPAMAERAVA